ncbi:MAG: T9SS type A sorting domain-containing protein [Saprospiraceae bacterium]
MRYIQNLIFTLLLFAFNSGLYAQCVSGSFNCNDTIQVSVDEMCEAIISADFILEQPSASCTYDLQFFDENDNLLNVPNNTLTVAHVGRTIKVKVRENGVANPNSCWGYIRVEDKIAAIIECPEFPDLSCLDSDQNDPGRSDEELAAYIRRQILTQDGIQDNCTDTASFEVSIIRNKLQQLQCTGDFGAQRLIEFDLIGTGGRVLLNCVDTIFFSKFDTDEVEDPRDFIGPDALECDGTSRFGNWEQDPDQDVLDKFNINIYPNFWELFNLDESSFPHIGGRPLIEYDEDLEAFVRKGFCNINAAFTDLPPFEICGKSYKIIRSWTIIDWCKSSPPRMINQIIEVKDTKAPKFTLANIPDADAGSNTCTMVIDLPVPDVTDECSEWTYCIAFKLPGYTTYTVETKYQNLDSKDVPDPKILPIGTTTILYALKDECGNADTMRMDVDVNDIQPPIAICDTRTVLTLNNNDKGKIFPPTIDDKSFDNCTDILVFRIWREDGKIALNAPDSSFVKFDAFDIDKDVRVMLEVIDESGLSNRCWTTVEVNSNTSVAPACPSSVRTFDFCDDFSSFLPHEAGLEAVVIDRQETSCGEGYLLVQWMDTTNNANAVLCVGDTIFFERQNSINTSDFALPLDIQVSACDNIAPSAQDLLSILNNSVSCNIEVIFQDVIFTEKVFRSYTVIDLCSNVALMHHTQIIEIIPSDLSDIDLNTIFDVPNPGITIEMEPDGNVDISAAFLNVAEGDECYTNLDIRVRKRGDGAFTDFVTFTCSDLATFVVFDLELALFDTDGTILLTKTTKVLIDDRIARACPAGSLTISGLIKTEFNEAVENVSVNLISVDNMITSATASSVKGVYAFTEMQPDQYRVVTSKNDDIINGVSTLDLILIQQHILGIQEFTSPYKIIASDVNNNNSVSAVDLLELRKVILGISDAFTNNTSWRFVKASETFNDIFNPWGFDEVHDVGGSGDFNFIGVKIGDVNSNVVANSSVTSPRSNISVDLIIKGGEIKKGQNTLIRISNNGNENAVGYQLKMNIAPSAKILNVYDGNLTFLSNEQYVIAEDNITISYNGKSLNSDFLIIEIQSEIDLDLSSVLSMDDSFNNEIYSQNLNVSSVKGIKYFNSNILEVTAFPNPFRDNTTLHIFSENDKMARISVYDINGKKIHVKPNVLLEKGGNQIMIESSDLLNLSGIYFYEVKMNNKSIRGKMIYLD